MPPSDLERFRGRRCLVTGGLGFIGSNLALTLHGVGAHVTVVDAVVARHGGSFRNLGGVDGIDVVVADVGDASAVVPPLARADFVFNVAGQVSHIDSMDDPLTDLDLNARSHLAFLELLRRVNPDAVAVYTSTRQVYGRPRYLPVDEDHPVNPVDVNGIANYAGEQFHTLYAQVHGLRTCALRLTNVYGPRQRLRGDHLGFLPVFVRRALEGQPIVIFGDGTQERDCLYVDDVVDALVLAALSADAPGEVFNVGHQKRLSLRSIADAVVTAAGGGSVELVPFPQELARIDIGSYLADASKAKRVLGWEPRVEFETGIARTIEFYRERLAWYL